MSYDERPEFQALAELERVLAGVAEELAAWRRRAQRAEAALGEDRDVVGQRERVMALEAENRDLRARLAAARGRVEELLKRLRFLEEQMELEERRR